MTRDERLRRMLPEARATYDRIRALREEIGPIDFDVVAAIRELRDDDETIVGEPVYRYEIHAT